MRLELAIYFSIQARDLGAAHLFSRWRSRCGFSRPLRLNALQEVAAQSRSAWPLFGFRLFLYLFWFRFFRRGRFWLCLLHRFWCRRSLLGRRRRCRSEEHTSELQSLMRISYAVFCLKKKKTKQYVQQ